MVCCGLAGDGFPTVDMILHSFCRGRNLGLVDILTKLWRLVIYTSEIVRILVDVVDIKRVVGMFTSLQHRVKFGEKTAGPWISLSVFFSQFLRKFTGATYLALRVRLPQCLF